nr:hypothetical protein [uncultured Ottowia sp.]
MAFIPFQALQTAADFAIALMAARKNSGFQGGGGCANRLAGGF